MKELQKQFKDMVVIFISGCPELTEQFIDEKINEIRTIPSFSVLTDPEIDEVRAEIKAEFSIKLDKGHLIEEKGHEKWFLSRKSTLSMDYWERYRKYLLSDKGFSAKVVNTMDDVLDTLTDLLGDPTRNVKFNRRGLIIGDVQSGKTANYTGLICKAVDSGYKVIVLLTGTIERLRRQTQERIDEGFVGTSSDAMMKQLEDQLTIGAGKYNSSIRPMVLTSTIDDFKQKNASNLNFDLRNINGPVIFVIKKNSSVLKRLNKWLKTFNQSGQHQINHSLLVIDDEADNASVNTKSDPDETPTAINGQIRDLLKTFAKSSYVGFTATPYANIFIDPDSFNAMVEEDLFPKNYIYSLNSPSNYIGARNIFDDNGDARGMLVAINDNEADPNSIASLLPLRHKPNTIIHNLPGDLKSAVRAFILANALEDIKGLTKNHRSMLINVSRFTNVQECIASLVNEYLKDLQAACRNYCALDEEKALQSVFIADIKDTFDTIYHDIDVPWIQVQKCLYSSCAGIIVQTFNANAGQNVNYDDYKDGLRVIAVGGMSLSRGLTLEGLVISYFYRNSKMYDTLMQMGRWFGYRRGYEELCKIWMSDESIEWYSHISKATDELRAEVKRYEDTGLTPMDFGLRVRSDINSLIVTARNKMRSTESRECIISLSGTCIETPEIYTDEAKNESNFRAVDHFLSCLLEDGYTLSPGRIVSSKKTGFLDVSANEIIDFLETIEVSPKNAEFNIKTIISFIKDYKGKELEKWDIELASGKSDHGISLCNDKIVITPPERTYSIENDGTIIKMSGSKRRLGTATDGVFGLTQEKLDVIKSRYDSNIPQDAYFENVSRNPLLIVYLVNPKSEKIRDEQGNIKKVANEKYDGKCVVGFGIGIPTLSNHETKYARYILNRIAIQQIFDGEDEDDLYGDED